MRNTGAIFETNSKAGDLCTPGTTPSWTAAIPDGVVTRDGNERTGNSNTRFRLVEVVRRLLRINCLVYKLFDVSANGYVKSVMSDRSAATVVIDRGCCFLITSEIQVITRQVRIGGHGVYRPRHVQWE